MGADLIGWRDCALQAPLGVGTFLSRIKMRGYRRAIEAQVPEAQRDTIKIQVVINRPEGPVQTSLSYTEIRAAAEEMEQGIPDCASCPMSEGGRPVSCYRYVTYPVDATTERTLFALFATEVEQKGSICERFHAAVLAQLPTSGTGWHTRRGGDARQGALAELDEPLVHTWGGFFGKRRLDSAQILYAILNPRSDAAYVALHAELHARIAAYATTNSLRAPCLDEIVPLAPFYDAIARHAAEGYRIYVDA